MTMTNITPDRLEWEVEDEKVEDRGAFLADYYQRHQAELARMSSEERRAFEQVFEKHGATEVATTIRETREDIRTLERRAEIYTFIHRMMRPLLTIEATLGDLMQKAREKGEKISSVEEAIEKLAFFSHSLEYYLAYIDQFASRLRTGLETVKDEIDPQGYHSTFTQLEEKRAMIQGVVAECEIMLESLKQMKNMPVDEQRNSSAA